jgi:hypothetical protein
MKTIYLKETKEQRLDRIYHQRAPKVVPSKKVYNRKKGW